MPAHPYTERLFNPARALRLPSGLFATIGGDVPYLAHKIEGLPLPPHDAGKQMMTLSLVRALTCRGLLSANCRKRLCGGGRRAPSGHATQASSEAQPCRGNSCTLAQGIAEADVEHGKRFDQPCRIKATGLFDREARGLDQPFDDSDGRRVIARQVL